MPPDEVLLSPASSVMTIFMPPMAEQTIWVACGLTKGEATETPMNKANHTSTRRVIRCALRRVCRADMATIIPWASRTTSLGHLCDAVVGGVALTSNYF